MPDTTSGQTLTNREEQLTYVLDTSVLLSDPTAFTKFEEHNVVLPLVVVTELEAKRSDPVIGWAARTALRTLEKFRIQYGAEGLTEGIVVNDKGGRIRIEVNHVDQSALPEPLRNERSNDTRILAVAKALQAEGNQVVVVSKDLPMRIRASVILRLDAQEYRNEQVVDVNYTGIEDVYATSDVIASLFTEGRTPLWEGVDTLPENTGLVVHGDTKSQSALAVVTSGQAVRVHDNTEAYGLTARSAAQRIAVHQLMNPDVGVVSLGGTAGTGKTALAIAAGLEHVVERKTHKKIIVVRSTLPVAGESLGYLPGDVDEKMAPYADAIKDVICSGLGHENTYEEILARKQLEIIPITFVRGRTLHDSWVIIDEAQNLEQNGLLTLLTRAGQGTKVVLTSDVNQRDNLRVGRNDGIAAVVEKLKGNPLFAHVTLTKTERSAVAGMAAAALNPDLLTEW